MKKIQTFLLMSLVLVGLLTGCGAADAKNAEVSNAPKNYKQTDIGRLVMVTYEDKVNGNVVYITYDSKYADSDSLEAIGITSQPIKTGDGSKDVAISTNRISDREDTLGRFVLVTHVDEINGNIVYICYDSKYADSDSLEALGSTSQPIRK